MKVLLLSPYPHLIGQTLRDQGDDITVRSDWHPLAVTAQFDWVVSYGYRHILKNTASLPPAVNLHIAYLPWNRGADPNYWSWRNGTPKGVTIHKIDDRIDTGPIYAQEETVFNGTTLRETYDELHAHIQRLFARVWPSIRSGEMQPKPQVGRGSYHLSAQKPNVDFDMQVSDLDRLHGSGFRPLQFFDSAEIGDPMNPRDGYNE